MALTPEGKVKAAINKVLAGPDIYYFQPVQGGFGKAGVDYHCLISCRSIALAFFIEAKRAGKEPTDRQATFLEDRRKQGAKCFVIDSLMGVKLLQLWIEDIRRASNRR